MHDTLDRLARLESEVTSLRRSQARWRRTTLAVGAIAVLGTMAGLAADGIADVLRARSVEIVGADGKVAIRLNAAEQGGQLDIWANGGANVARLAAAESGGDLSLWNTAGKAAAGVYAHAGGGRLEVSRGDGQLAGYLEATPEGSDLAMSRTGSETAATRFRVKKDRSEAILAQAEANSVLVFGATTQGAAVTVLGNDDKEIAYLGGDAKKAGMLRLRDAAGASMVESGTGEHGGELMVRANGGKPAAVLGTGDQGGFVESHGKEGQLAARLGSGERGGAVEALNADGKTVASLAVQDNNGGRVAACTATGQIVAFMDQGKDESGTLQLYAGPNRVAAIGGSATGGLMNLFNLKGKAVFIAGAAADGPGGAFSLQTDDGTRTVRARAEPVPEISATTADGKRRSVVTPPPAP